MVIGQLQHFLLGHWINIWCHERGDREAFPCDSHQRSSGPDRDETGQEQQGRGGQQHNVHLLLHQIYCLGHRSRGFENDLGLTDSRKGRLNVVSYGEFLRLTSATKQSVRDAAAKFQAICVPVGEDREFRCHNPECQAASYRLYKAKANILMSCEEFKKETGLSER